MTRQSDLAIKCMNSAIPNKKGKETEDSFYTNYKNGLYIISPSG